MIQKNANISKGAFKLVVKGEVGALCLWKRTHCKEPCGHPMCEG
jgi:hypothetical protein